MFFKVPIVFKTQPTVSLSMSVISVSLPLRLHLWWSVSAPRTATRSGAETASQEKRRVTDSFMIDIDALIRAKSPQVHERCSFRWLLSRPAIGGGVIWFCSGNSCVEATSCTGELCAADSYDTNACIANTLVSFIQSYMMGSKYTHKFTL